MNPIARATSLVALCLVVASCATVTPQPDAGSQLRNSAAVEEARAAFPARLAEVRLRAWHTALEIVDVYQHIPEDRCPGIAALVRDIRAVEWAVGPLGKPNLDAIGIDQLVTKNPHFWRAALEISPNDGSFLLLHATLLAAAGEIWRADRILTATTQLLPLPPSVRPYYLAQSYGLGSLILLSVRCTPDIPAHAPSAKAIATIQDALVLWPNNAVLLSELIDARIRARVSTLKRPSREELMAEIDKALMESHDEIERLFALDPVSAAPYRGNSDERKQGRQLRSLWSRLADSDAVLGHKEIGDLAQRLETAEAPELSLAMYRLQVVARGFPGPSDAAAWKRVLPKLIGSGETEELFAAADRGELNVVELNQETAPGVEEWKGDPAIHPLLIQQVQREIADLSFQVELLRDNPKAQADVLRQRGVQYSRAGLYDESLADLEAAMKSVGRTAPLLLEQSIVYSAMGRDADAERLLAEAEKSSRDGKVLASRERGIFLFGKARYGEALTALRSDVANDPEAVYSAILAELAARRIGKSELSLLKKVRQKSAPGSWPDVCLSFLSGHTTQDTLLKTAQQGDSLETAQKLCEAYFILAQVSLASGDRARGVDFLESCIDTGITGYVEFRLARIELKRLAPDREVRTRQWEDKAPSTRPGSEHPKDHEPAEEELMDETAPA